MLQCICKKIDWQYEDGNQELKFVLHVPEIDMDIKRLLDGVSQLHLSFSSEQLGQGSFLSFVLRSGNGEIAILIEKKEWVHFLEEPDLMIIDYGDRFEMPFLPNTLLKYVDQLIEQYNNGENTPLLRDIIEVFAEEEID